MSKITVDMIRVMLERDAEHNKFFLFFTELFIERTRKITIIQEA